MSDTSTALSIYERVGFAGPLGRARIVSALPPNEPPRWIRPHHVVHSDKGAYLGDANGTLVGKKGFWCQRILSATVTTDTRRL